MTNAAIGFEPDGAIACWEDAPLVAPASAAPVLVVDGFEGPLDWLLELARAERIDLRQLSILALVEAFAAALERALTAAARADLSRWAEYLVMAAQLALLRSRLLLPPNAPEAAAARADAEVLRRQLLQADAMRRAAVWLEAQVQLGRDVFGRRAADAERRVGGRSVDIADLFRACLVVLRVPELAKRYAPPTPTLWRVPEAIARITQLLADDVQEELWAYLPKLSPDATDRDLLCRSAVASTLVAGLELARGKAVSVDQIGPWQAIRFTKLGQNLG